MDLDIREGGLEDPRVVALLQLHHTRAHAVTPAGSAHALDLAGLRRPDLSFWSAWWSGEPVGTGALRVLDAGHGELKSMFTADTARGRGVARALVQHIVAAARARGLARLSLETGSFGYFAPARALYTGLGFEPCAPFADYRLDPNSVFMTRTL